MRSRVLGAATFLLARFVSCTSRLAFAATFFRCCAQRYHLVPPRHWYWSAPPLDRVIAAAAATAADATYKDAGGTTCRTS
jgi:hypothetical protein